MTGKMEMSWSPRADLVRALVTAPSVCLIDPSTLLEAPRRGNWTECSAKDRFAPAPAWLSSSRALSQNEPPCGSGRRGKQNVLTAKFVENES